MASKLFGPRKRRTREHVIADLSVHHVEGFILEEGHTAQRLGSDYGYDLIAFTYDERGCIEPGSIYFQVKASESLQAVGSDYVFDVDIRDYNLWTLEDTPVILILFDFSQRRGYWLFVQNYFGGDGDRGPKKGARTVRVRVPARHQVNQKAVAKWRTFRREARDLLRGGR